MNMLLDHHHHHHHHHQQHLKSIQTRAGIMAEKEKSTKSNCFPILGIGASAGGLETLKAFFSKMPPDTGMAFVIIQHLSPDHESCMASLLEKHTSMVVVQIKDDTKVQPNQVYLNPPGKNVAIFNGKLHLLEQLKTSAVNMPVDFFLRSLSEDLGERAIAIILSGTASDGSLGIKAIKGQGGMIMVQQPDTAKYDGMPKSAIETGLVDFIRPVENMAETLIKYVRHPFLELPEKIRSRKMSKNHMQKIFAIVRSATGHDFSNYKQNTIFRRIERRMVVHQIKNLSDYVLFLQKNFSEIDMLFKNMIIGVTSFFRDPEAYQILEQEVLPNLFKDKPQDADIRLWVTGCSTGEEAYSLAIIVSEVMDKIKKCFNVQIFATDIDMTAIDIARRGLYPENIGADISPNRLDQFFTKSPKGFHVKKSIRDMIVFSVQNLIKDPPFSRLDLVSCRNLMIYMDAVLQKKIIPLFHYTLNPGGILFLGTSESVGENRNFFETLSPKWKIFMCSKDFEGRQIDSPSKFYPEVYAGIKQDENHKLTPNTDLQSMVEKTILDAYAPSGVLINDKYEILHFVGKTEKYLVPPTGSPSFNLLSMAREDIKNKLTINLHKAIHERTNAFCRDLKVVHNGMVYAVDISIIQMPGKGLPPGAMLVMFEDKTPLDVSGEKKIMAVRHPSSNPKSSLHFSFFKF